MPKIELIEVLLERLEIFIANLDPISDSKKIKEYEMIQTCYLGDLLRIEGLKK
ncbi:MAG: hypothetical protein V1860_01740 [bacterium]